MTTCISAPGKVLLAGGYLVLDRAYSGVVISTSSRFYTIVRPAGVDRVNRILVRSPQFESASWEYSTTIVDRVYKVVPEDNSSRNKFVELALQRTLLLAVEVSGVIVGKVLAEGLDIAIVGDNDFYSQRAALADAKLPPTRESLKTIKPFKKTGTAIKDVHKTGLGSSAALITSLVAALLVHFEVFPASHLSSDATSPAAKDSRRLVHNLAQHVHCLAQGKVGSGFDVSAAVFGSQLYTRFSPSVLGPLMVDDLPAGSQLNPIISPNNTAWDYIVKRFQLPPRIKLMLADVNAGSDTPSLVGKVLKWRSSNQEEANALWTEIDSTNTALANQLTKLSGIASQENAEYNASVSLLSSKRTQEWEAAYSASHISVALYETHKITELIRSHMRDMSGRTGVPIEPPEQTELLNACLDVPGVVGGGVPGAGGYDALWVLVLDPENVGEKPSDRVEQVWASWKKLHVSPLLAEESHTGGCRLEDVEKVPGLQAATAA